MAEVWMPADEVSRNGLRVLNGVPFLLTDNGDYPEGLNLYIFARSQNIARPGGKTLQGFGPSDRPSSRTMSALAYDLADLLTWGEDAEAHPSVGQLGVEDLQEWHIRELYVPAMREGFWSQDYFRTSEPRPLASGTIQRRANTALHCFRWLYEKGYVAHYFEEPDEIEVKLHKDSVLLAHLAGATTVTVRSTGIGRRRNPGDIPLPSRTQLMGFFNAFDDVTYRLIANLFFECGPRVSEVADELRVPDGAVRRYDLTRDTMLGVIPTRDDIVRRNGAFTGTMPIRIRGKGGKIRTLDISVALLLRIWRYVDSQAERGWRAAGYRRRRGYDPEWLFLNSKCGKVSTHSIQEAFRKASNTPSATVRLTPHELRHAFAVYFLESAVLREAHEVGIPLDNLTPDFLREAGSRALLVLKDILGHESVRTTERYLAQLMTARLKRAALDSWQYFLAAELSRGTRYGDQSWPSDA